MHYKGSNSDSMKELGEFNGFIKPKEEGFRHCPLMSRGSIERIDGPDGRMYLTPQGNKYPSITHVLSKNKSQELINWQKAVGEDMAKAYSRRAANRGTLIHEITESFLMNEEPVFKNFLLKDSFTRFKPVLRKINNIRLLEAKLYSDLYKIAGTIDCLAEYDGELSVIDFKTSNNPKHRSMIDNYFTQAYAYKVMVEELYGLEVKKLVILISVDHDFPQTFTSDDFATWNVKLREALQNA